MGWTDSKTLEYRLETLMGTWGEARAELPSTSGGMVQEHRTTGVSAASDTVRLSMDTLSSQFKTQWKINSINKEIWGIYYPTRLLLAEPTGV